MKNHLGSMTMCVALLALAGGSAPATADDRPGKCCKIDVDIDDLDADLYPDGDGWLLHVRYEVEVEDACDQEQLQLNLQFSNDDSRVVDADGHPLLHTIRLDRPTECDDDEQTFEGSVELRLTGNEVGDPDDFEVNATVTRVGESRVLDKENTDADVHLPRAVVECRPSVVEVRHVEPVIVEAPRPYCRPLVYVDADCRSAVVTVSRPYYVHVGVRW